LGADPAVRWLAALLLTALSAIGPARADVVADAFVGVFLHEVAHALIDVLELPPGPSEEDTADALSVWLIDRLYSDDRGAQIVAAHSATFAAYAAEGEDEAYRGRHAPDAVRAARLPCLLAGPCAAERAALWAGFDAAFEGRPPQDHGPGLRIVPMAAEDGAAAAVREAAARFNGEIGLPASVDVAVEPCGSPDAFYDPRARRVVMCVEYAAELARLHGR
jgi:Putative metallopeptidase